MKLYPLFVLMAATTVLSPGPGVVMTITNALRYGMKGTIGGILGIAVGALVVAGASATSLGLLLSTSATAFTIMKLAGAAYLIYLGARLWQAPGLRFDLNDTGNVNFTKRFTEGVSLQLTNPKAVFFFLSVLPQFIDRATGYAVQFFILVLTYSTLVVVIHCLYASVAHRARNWLASDRGGRAVNKAGAATFVLFGAALAGATR
ncbi:LysE family translocator [Noviherbaspirillum sp.]|uniref:LysE family translocator n=1 Tax=Noviherbaspirillum sp. TaxID=1926288 RepID=UPI002FE14F7B